MHCRHVKQYDEKCNNRMHCLMHFQKVVALLCEQNWKVKSIECTETTPVKKVLCKVQEILRIPEMSDFRFNEPYLLGCWRTCTGCSRMQRRNLQADVMQVFAPKDCIQHCRKVTSLFCSVVDLWLARKHAPLSRTNMCDKPTNKFDDWTTMKVCKIQNDEKDFYDASGRWLIEWIDFMVHFMYMAAVVAWTLGGPWVLHWCPLISHTTSR